MITRPEPAPAEYDQKNEQQFRDELVYEIEMLRKELKELKGQG